MANGDVDFEEESRRREEAEFSRWLTRKRPDDWLLEAPSDLYDSGDRDAKHEEPSLPPASAPSAHAAPVVDELVALVPEACRKAVASPSIESLSSLPSLPSSALSTPPTTPLASQKAAGRFSFANLCH